MARCASKYVLFGGFPFPFFFPREKAVGAGGFTGGRQGACQDPQYLCYRVQTFGLVPHCVSSIYFQGYSAIQAIDKSLAPNPVLNCASAEGPDFKTDGHHEAPHLLSSSADRQGGYAPWDPSCYPRVYPGLPRSTTHPTPSCPGVSKHLRLELVLRVVSPSTLAEHGDGHTLVPTPLMVIISVSKTTPR